MAETTKKKYKFGIHDIDLKDYIYNLQQNVDSFVADRVKNGGWTEDQVQEFYNSHSRYMKALQDQYDSGSSRLSTDAAGLIMDINNELNDTDSDDYRYNAKGERISGEDYAALKLKKQKKYKDFEANRYWSTFAKKVGNKLIPVNNASEKSTDAFNNDKHGWLNWWTTVKNLDGGRNITPYIDLDKVEADGKRLRTNRAKAASGWIGEYRNWLKGKNLNYDNYAVDYATLDNRLAELQKNWGDGNWNEADLTSAALAGIDHTWLDKFFTDLENPDVSSEKLKADKEKQDAEAKKKAEEEDWDNWFNTHYNNYIANSGNFNDDNEFYFGQLPEQTLDEIRDSLAKGTNYQDYINNYLKNPFDNTDTKALNMIIQSKYAQPLEDGYYYIPQDNDEKNGMALVYNPTTGKMKYTFIGNIKPVWNRMKNKRNIERGTVKLSSLYREGGEIIETMLVGGSFDFNTFMNQNRQAQIDARAQLTGKTSKQLEAGERYIDSDNASMQNPDAGFTGIEITRLASIGGDITSMIIGMAGGNIASSAVGAASTTANLFADIADDSTTAWETFKNAAFGYTMDIVGAIPVFGATGKMAKMAKSALKLAPKAMAVIGTMSGIANAGAYYDSWKKLVESDGKVTVNDWRNIAASIQLIAGGTAAIARQRAVKKAANTDMVAMDFVDKNTGAKQTRIFEGADAAKIREANGDLTKLKAETTGKFEELKDLELDVTGTKEGFSLFGKKWGAKEGTAGVYDVKNGANGLFVERGWATPDTMTTGMRRPGQTIADAAAAKTAAQEAEIVAQMNPLKTQSDAIEARMGTKDAKITSILNDIDAHTAGYTGRSSAAINADLTRVRNANSSGEFTRRQDAFNKRKASGVLDEVDAAGNVTKLGKTSVALSRNLDKQRQLNKQIKLKQADLASATDPNVKKSLKKEINNLQLEKAKTEANAQKIKDTQSKQNAANTADAEYLKLNDIAQEAGLNTELGAAQTYEKTLNNLRTRLDAWKRLNDPNFHSAARQRMEANVKPDGTIEFTLSGGDKVTRNWLEILTKYGIKYRKGGSIRKFQDGGGVNNTITDGTLDWYKDMFSHENMLKYINSIQSDADIENFNNLQLSWRNNLNQSGYTPGGKAKAYSGVSPYLGKWHLTGNNAQIQALQNSGRISARATGKDNANGNYQDGLFGEQEYLRHAGSLESWKNYQNELKDFLAKLLKERGLDYYYDDNSKMYLLRKNPALGNANGTVTDPVTGITRPLADVDKIDVSENAEGIHEILNGLPVKSSDTYANLRAYLANAYNDRTLDLENRALMRFHLKNALEHSRTVKGDLDAVRRGLASQAQLNLFASMPTVTDAQVQNAIRLDALVKGLGFANEGLQTDNTARKQSEELVLAQNKENKASVHAASEANRETIDDAAQAVIRNEELRQHHKFSNIIDPLLQERQFNALQNEAKQEAQQESWDKMIRLDNIMNDPNAYGANLSPEELQAWTEFRSGKADSAWYKTNQHLVNAAYTKIEQTIMYEEAKALHLNTSKFKRVREQSADKEWDPTIGVPLSKDGSKIEVLRLKNLSKDHDRFHKNILKNFDRTEKKYDRLSKYSKKKNNK